MVVARALSAEELATIERVVAKTAGGAFAASVEMVPAIERTAVGKLRAFRSELPG